MLFWPVIVLPSSRPAEMWWVKFVFIAGRMDMLDGTPQIEERR